MCQPVENTAYCLRCTNEWPAVWPSKEIALVCPKCRWRLGGPIELVRSGWWTTQGYDGDRSETDMDGRERRLWDRIHGLLEQDLAERRDRKLFVAVPGEFGSDQQKEIGELSASERRSLPPALGERVAERLLDRYLAGQGYVDLVEGRRAYTKKIEDLTPQDLPALVEADRYGAEEEHRKERERAVFVRDVRANLELLHVLELAEMTETGEEARR